MIRFDTEVQMSDNGAGSRKVEATTKEVCARAHRVYDPLLTRKAETDKIRQSLSILSRFSFLFTLPSKIAANIRDGEYDKAVQHYKKAASIFQDQTAISHVYFSFFSLSSLLNIVFLDFGIFASFLRSGEHSSFVPHDPLFRSCRSYCYFRSTGKSHTYTCRFGSS